MVEKSGVEKSGVEKSGVEMFTQSLGLKLGVEKSMVEISFNRQCLYRPILAIKLESVLQVLFMARKYYIFNHDKCF